MTGETAVLPMDDLFVAIERLATDRGQPVFVSLSEDGIAGAKQGNAPEHVPCLPLRGEIDIVGAGDAVMANLAIALAAGAEVVEAMKFSMAAASVVVHQLGTTGTANLAEIRPLVCAH